jgi:hypothetical protein
MKHSRIQTLAKECEALFEKRKSTYQQQKREEGEEERLILEPQYARFNLWANNNGKFAVLLNENYPF